MTTAIEVEPSGANLSGLIDRLRKDARRFRRYQRGKFGYAPVIWFVDPGWVCVLLHRLSHFFWFRGWMRSARLLMQTNSLLTGADIQPQSNLGGGLLIPSPCGVNISAKIGENLTAMALTGVGGSVRDADVGAGIGLPLIGRDVVVNWFTGVQGSITVGDAVVFGPGVGAVVDVAAGTHMWLALPPRIGERRPELEAFHLPLPDCDHANWPRTWSDFRADVERYRAELSAYAPPGSKPAPRLSAALTNPLLALIVYRLSHWLHLNGYRRWALLLSQSNVLMHKLTIPPCACLGGGVLMPHLGGCVFHGTAGERLTFYAGSLCTSFGGAFSASREAAPLLGDDVLVAGHAGAFGPITVGGGAQVAPKAQLLRDLEARHGFWDRSGRGSANAPDESPSCDFGDASAEARRSVLVDDPWRETRARMRRDRERLGGAPRFPALVSVWLYRLSHAFYVTGRLRLARWTWLINVYLTGADISPCCEIGAGLLIPHPAGLTLHCRAGDDLTLGALTGITAALGDECKPPSLDRSPTLGDRVRLAHHACVFGPIEVGDDASIEPGCVATRSVSAGVALLRVKPRLRPLATGDRLSFGAAGRALAPGESARS